MRHGHENSGEGSTKHKLAILLIVFDFENCIELFDNDADFVLLLQVVAVLVLSDATVFTVINCILS